MDLEDFLEEERFKELDIFLTGEMYRTAGCELVKRMTEVLGEENSAREWFYTRLILLGNKRPYDLCKAGERLDVETLLGRIDYGVLP